MLYEAARSAMLAAAQWYVTGVDSANWLFSQTNTTGSFQIAARFIASCVVPCSAAPSPKKHATTARLRSVLAVSAAPAASGGPPPTMPFAPSMPRDTSAMCIEPPLPLQDPVARPKSSAIISSSGTPFAMQWPWPRCVDVM